MENIIKVGVGIMIKKDNKILLGHRSRKTQDTGGIYEPDTWTFPGGKQDYKETIFECAFREVQEETNLLISNMKVFSVSDDIQVDRHFVTIQVIAENYDGELKVMEPDKIDEWKWFSLDNLPDNLYSPTKKFIDNYLKEMER